MSKQNVKKFMQALNLPQDCIDSYEKDGTIYCSTSVGMRKPTPFIQGVVDSITNQFGDKYTVYHVIASRLNKCKIIDCLLCPKDEYEVEYYLDSAKQGYPLSYCENRTIPEYTGAGDIHVVYHPEIKSLSRIG